MFNNRFNGLKKLHKQLNGDTIEYDLSAYKSIVDKINDAREGYKVMTNSQLQNISKTLKKSVLHGGQLDSIYIEAFALVRETLHRILHIEPFDEQIIGAIVLFKNRLAEMQTGEGKTLTAVFPAYVNALTGKGVHILTFNDYLARRDAQWMGPAYEFLGLRVEYINQGMTGKERKKAYNADITYLTAKESGYDYLRDSMCYTCNDIVHRPLHYAIIDEADSILIDEARTPLVIAGAAASTISASRKVSDCVTGFKETVDYEFDDYKRNVMLTEQGIQKIEKEFACGNLYDGNNIDLLSSVHYALHAHFLLQKNRDYIVRNSTIEMVDECTGRVADRRKWPDGLHEAVEIKERCPVGNKGIILNTLTLQHFLLQYPRLCGMSATAQAAEEELRVFYNLHITVIPPHRKCIRNDSSDILFKTREEKFAVVIDEILRIHLTGQPILVGTQSIDDSERLANTLLSKNIQCTILNAKNDEHEARIIAEAGSIGAITISTNMAGRGTDIRLGGSNQEQKGAVSTLGGLYVIGTSRFESSRIDNQLRGRAARQGDPGQSRFLISLEDDLFVKYKLVELLPESTKDLKNPKVTKEINRVQRIIEGQHLEIKIDLYKYSSLLEQQRTILFEKRSAILFDDAFVLHFFEQFSSEQFRRLKECLTPEEFIRICRTTALITIDNSWSSYLTEIDALKDGIHLRRIGGQNPLFEFRKISIEMFKELIESIDSLILAAFEKLEIKNGCIDFENSGLKQPSATWTYLVNDDPFERKFGMQMVSNICINAGAGFLWPVTMLVLFIKKLKKS